MIKGCYEIQAVQCFFPKNKKYDGKYKFELYRDNKTPYFISGCIYKTTKNALDAGIKTFLLQQNGGEWNFNIYENNVIIDLK